MIISEDLPDLQDDQPRAPAAVDVSVGVDLVEVRRLSRLAGTPLGLTGVLTEREQKYCYSRHRPAEHIAARFAGKEAVLKALGTGLSESIRWTDVEILKHRDGRPKVVLHGGAAAVATARGLLRLDVSLSHTAHLAVAHAAALWATPGPSGS